MSGIGCNWLVCLAVWLSYASREMSGKILGIWFPNHGVRRHRFPARGSQHVPDSGSDLCRLPELGAVGGEPGGRVPGECGGWGDLRGVGVLRVPTVCLRRKRARCSEALRSGTLVQVMCPAQACLTVRHYPWATLGDTMFGRMLTAVMSSPTQWNPDGDQGIRHQPWASDLRSNHSTINLPPCNIRLQGRLGLCRIALAQGFEYFEVLVLGAGQFRFGHFGMEGAEQRPHHHPHVLQGLEDHRHACGGNQTEVELAVEQRSLFVVGADSRLEGRLHLFQMLQLGGGNSLGRHARRLALQQMADQLDFP
ncbi:transporter of formate/nitrite family protein [Pseudomonas putida S11]|nr:transporter of formate/nitrite family protein [Pseudomonas putida S11]